MFCDASKRSWGGVLPKDRKRIESRDYWPDSSDDFCALEAMALPHSFLAFSDHILDPRVDVYTDNQTLKADAAFSGTYGLIVVFSKCPLFSYQVLLPWKSVRRCGSCLYPNASLCQACGIVTAPVKPAVQLGRGAVDEKAILQRFQSFKSFVGYKPYQRQKSALEQEFSA